MLKISGIDHLVLTVSDFGKSKKFYGELLKFLGFEVLDDCEDAIGWTNGSTRVWLYEADAKARKYRRGDIGFEHYAFQLKSRKDVYALEKFVRKMGAKIVDPADQYYDDYWAVFFLDPDGMRLEGMHYGK